MCCSVVCYANVRVLFSPGSNVFCGGCWWGDAYLVLWSSVLMEALWWQLCVCVIFCWPVWPWLTSYVCR